jgi:hypothetical protein
MNPIKKTFDHLFARWEITLPEDVLEQRLPGSIQKKGWTINYRFDVVDGQPYIEYFASHRMTNDTLSRIYCDGRYELVDYCQEFYQAGNPESEKAYLEHNRNCYAKVKPPGLF